MIRNSASEMASKLASGEVTSVALTQAHLDQISAIDKDVHAYAIKVASSSTLWLSEQIKTPRTNRYRLFIKYGQSLIYKFMVKNKNNIISNLFKIIDKIEPEFKDFKKYVWQYDIFIMTSIIGSCMI